MGNFISNLIARHTTAASYVMPRLRGRFESQPGPAEEVMPASSYGNVAPSADHTPAAAGALPERPGPAGIPPPEPPKEERTEQASVPPANRTVAPPATLLSLFAAPSAASPSAAQPAAGPPTDHHDTMPIGGTVNNLFVMHPPPENGRPDTPSTAPEQTPPAAVRPLYFSIQPPGQQGMALPPYNGNGSPDRQMQRTGQHSTAASAPQPVIKVSIGRIDVRALTQPAAAKSNTAGKAAMSLDDFLKKRSGGTS